MKKIFLFILLGLIPGSTVFAEEMIVHLTSGNSVVIQYTGSIQGVTFKGNTDGIAGLDMPAATASGKNPDGTQQPATGTRQPAAAVQTSAPQQEQVEAKKEEGRGFRFKWAEPKTED